MDAVTRAIQGGNRGIKMAKMIFDEDGLLEEPCLSCDNAYVEDIWYGWCCDEKECYMEQKVRNNDKLGRQIKEGYKG